MSIQTKKRFKNVSKAIAIALFALLMFTNIKIATIDSSELAKGDISIFGIQVTLFDATDAYDAGGCDSSCETSTYYQDGSWHYVAVWTQECSYGTYTTYIWDDICY